MKQFVLHTVAFYAVFGIPWFVALIKGESYGHIGIVTKQSLGLFRAPAAFVEWVFHTVIDFFMTLYEFPIGTIAFALVIYMWYGIRHDRDD